MSAKIMGQVWDLKLPVRELLVLMAFADHADHDGNQIWPTIGLIAWKTGYGERQVRRIKALLVKSGLLVEQESQEGSVKVYSINISAGHLKAPYGSKKSVVVRPKRPKGGGPSYDRGDNTEGAGQVTTGGGGPSYDRGGRTFERLDETKKADLPRSSARARARRRTVIEPSFNRQGERAREARPPKVEPEVPGEHQEFIRDWCEAFEAQWSNPYSFAAGRDGKAVQVLLKLATAQEVMEIALRAWSELKAGYLREKAVTIHGLAHAWSEVVTSLKGKPNPLNPGVDISVYFPTEPPKGC